MASPEDACSLGASSSKGDGDSECGENEYGPAPCHDVPSAVFGTAPFWVYADLWHLERTGSSSITFRGPISSEDMLHLYREQQLKGSNLIVGLRESAAERLVGEVRGQWVHCGLQGARGGAGARGEGGARGTAARSWTPMQAPCTCPAACPAHHTPPHAHAHAHGAAQCRPAQRPALSGTQTWQRRVACPWRAPRPPRAPLRLYTGTGQRWACLATLCRARECPARPLPPPCLQDIPSSFYRTLAYIFEVVKQNGHYTPLSEAHIRAGNPDLNWAPPLWSTEHVRAPLRDHRLEDPMQLFQAAPYWCYLYSHETQKAKKTPPKTAAQMADLYM